MPDFGMGLRAAVRTLWDPTDQTGHAARSVAAYMKMGYADLNRRTVLPIKGDTAFLMGSGPSILDITDREWAHIAGQTSIGMNHWLVHPFATDYYLTISTTRVADNGESGIEKLLRLRLPDYRDTTFICRGDEVNFFRFHERPFGRTLMRECGPRCLFTRELFQYSGCAANPVLLLRHLIDHGLFGFGRGAAFLPKPTATVPAMFALAAMLGCRNVVFCGVDMTDALHFYEMPEYESFAPLLPPRKTDMRHPHEGGGGRRFPIRQILRDMAELFAERFGMRAYTMSAKSRLATVFPVYGGEKTRCAVLCPSAAKVPLPAAAPPEKPLNLAMLTNSFLPVVGGLELQLDRLARELVARGHAVTVFAPAEQQPGGDAEAPYALARFSGGFARGPLAERPRHRPLGLLPGSLHQQFLRRHLVRRFDAISAHSAFEAAPFALALRALHGVPVLTRCHGMDINRMPEIGYGWRLDPANDAAISAAIAGSDLCVAISDDVVAELAAMADPARIVRIPNGVDAAAFSPGNGADLRSRLGIPAAAPVLLMAGRAIPSKRFDAGVEAFAQVLAAFPDAHLLHAGKDAGALAALAAELGVADRVHLLGAVPHAELPGVYRAASLFLNPSVLETFGNVTCEAMACGLPVVAADAPGTRFQVVDGQTGVLVKAPSPQRLAAATIRVLARADGGAALGAAGRKRVEAVFAWPAVAAAYEAQYRRLAAVDTLFPNAEAAVDPLTAAVDRDPLAVPPILALARRLASAHAHEAAAFLLLDAAWMHRDSRPLHEALAATVNAALTAQRAASGGRESEILAAAAQLAQTLVERHLAISEEA